MRGHKMSDCRRFAKFRGKYRVHHNKINIAVVSTAEAVIEEIFMVNISMEVIRVEINSKEDGEIKKEVLTVQRRPQVKKGLKIHTHFLVCLSANKDITWLIDYVAMDHLIKEDTHVINKYKLSAPTKIHIAKNNNYLLAYEKGDIIGETCVNGEVRNIRIPDVLLVKDLLLVCKI
jgi:hypothetical protein